MSLYGMENFAYGDVAATFTTGQTKLSMFTGHTARFTTFPCMAVLYNNTDYDTPHEAFYEPSTPDAEIIEIVSKSSDTFNVIKRGQDGTSAIETTAGKSYRVAVIASRSQWDKICRAQPDAAGPFDAILEGTAAAVTNALARFVKDNTIDDAVVSFQGSPTNGDSTSLWIGDTADPDNFQIKRTRNTGTPQDVVALILNSLNMMTMHGENNLGLMDASPGQDGGISLGQTVRFDKFFGIKEEIVTIDGAGAIDVESNFVRVSANGGPGSDDLDTITVTNPPAVNNRLILFLEPNTTAHNITVRDGVGNIRLNSSGGNFLMNAQDHMLCVMSDGVSHTNFFELFRTAP